MKVLFITREGYQLSGARVRCYNFARELNAAGIEAKVFSFADQLGAKYGEKEFSMSLWEKLRLNVQAFRILLKESRETVFVLQRVNYHILAPLLVAFFKRNKVVLDLDDWNIRENPVYFLGFYPSSKMEYLTRCVARKARVCIAASDYLKSYLLDFNERTYLIPTGVDAELFCPCPRHEDGRVIFFWVGTAYHLEMGDNLSFILDCFLDVADKCENVHLSLAGEGRYFESLRPLVAACRHAHRISVHSWVQADQMPAHLRRVDVGLLPLIQDTKFNKGKSPTKLFEYMSMAKPVVASQMGEASRIVEHGRTGFLARDKKEFVDAMRALVQDASLRLAMGQQGRAAVEAKYSLHVLGRQLVDIINNLRG